ncbi:MAG: S-adenosylmethionine:tRNA ribosyltransferase-isomerase [Miltoncostaeaceae bacterium]|nr:S-adenosylmethionine:tRNA ribosyltransferase-isomerase [Miltoncostaeaceae bacterium]
MSAAVGSPPGPLDFELPPELEAGEPPEARGLPRDGVRLLVARPAEEPLHARFRDLPTLLEPGDLLVVNTSATLPAALPALAPDGAPLRLHLSTPAPLDVPEEGPEPVWIVELRRPVGAGSLRFGGGRPGWTLSLPAGGRARLLARHPADGRRLWAAALALPAPLLRYLTRHGEPIRYGHARRALPLADHQTVYALEPGSAEMPSAGRPFTAEVITGLVARGIGVAPLVLHCGVSSPEAGEPPLAERFRVPEHTAARIRATREEGGRVIAVGTTVVRALESAAEPGGEVRAAEGWTDLVVGPDRPARTVDGLLTGWHEPRGSHLLLLEAVAGRALVEASYRAALAAGYLWHEFGDSHLLLGERAVI